MSRYWFAFWQAIYDLVLLSVQAYYSTRYYSISMAEHGLTQCEQTLHMYCLIPLTEALVSYRYKTGLDIIKSIPALEMDLSIIVNLDPSSIRWMRFLSDHNTYIKQCMASDTSNWWARYYRIYFRLVFLITMATLLLSTYITYMTVLVHIYLPLNSFNFSVELSLSHHVSCKFKLELKHHIHM